MHIRCLTAEHLHVGQELHILPLLALFLDKARFLILEDATNIDFIDVPDAFFVAFKRLSAHFSHTIQGLTQRVSKRLQSLLQFGNFLLMLAHFRGEGAQLRVALLELDQRSESIR